MADMNLTEREQRALTRMSPEWFDKYWETITTGVFRQSTRYMQAVRDLASEEDRLNEELDALERENLERRMEITQKYIRKMDGGQ